jgi:hypothetical protein
MIICMHTIHTYLELLEHRNATNNPQLDPSLLGCLLEERLVHCCIYHHIGLFHRNLEENHDDQAYPDYLITFKVRSRM